MSPATATATAEYELVLMLDPEAPDERREQIAATVRERIEAGGAVKHDTVWGMRKLAYEIRQRTEADYRFFRFETAGPLLDELNHNLRITDGVLRFRIFKVDPRSPVIAPPPPAAATGAVPRGRRPSGPREGEGAAAEEAVAEAGVEEVGTTEAEAEQPEAPAEQPAAEAAEESPPAEEAEPAPEAEGEQPPAEPPAE